MKIRALANIFSFIAGAWIALFGVMWFFIAASGAIETGAVAGYVAGVGFLLVAAPLLTFPFSVRVAKSLLVLVLLVLAFGTLWLTFQPDPVSPHPALLRGAAVAFVVLLLARAGLAPYRKRLAVVT